MKGNKAHQSRNDTNRKEKGNYNKDRGRREEQVRKEKKGVKEGLGIGKRGT